ncbi:MAG: RsmB/NOP family class I SAM-dependent RNA methyltransferase [Paracoccaceae bacterium]
MIHPDMPEAVRLECPDWAIAPLRRRFGPAFAAEMAATLTPPPLDLRVNSVRTTRAAVLRTCSASVSTPRPPRSRPTASALRESLARLPGLKTGEVEIQDEGSQLVAMLVDARPGARVVDFCAGAGGKTLAIAAQMNNKGRIVACDVSEGRLKRGAERFRRAGVHNAETRLLASETDKWVKRHKGGFDRVLVDAPAPAPAPGGATGCPLARVRGELAGKPPGPAGLILASAARLVKPGGRLVYATCSMLSEENEERVAGFLAAHPDFSVVPLGVAAPALKGSAHPDFLSLTPLRHDTDGFFAAVLVRAEPVPPQDPA